MEKVLVYFLVFIASISMASGQTAETTPAGSWVASCDGPKLKFDEGYEIRLIQIDTGAYDPGYFSSEFYFAVDYVKEGEVSEFDCADEHQTWEDWGINLYFSFSYSGSYSENKVLFDAGEGYSVQNSYQLKPEFIKIDAGYELISPDQLKLTINGAEYLFHQMNRKE